MSTSVRPPLATLALRRRLLVAAMLALLTLAGLSLAGPADAGVRDFRVGVVATDIRGGDLERMADAGVHTVRTTLLWHRVEVTRGDGKNCGAVYDWTRYDQLFAEARRVGVRVLPILIGSPSYAAAEVPHTPRPGAIDDYRCFVRAAVKQYGRGGVQPTLRATDPITSWQVWNEPNLRVFSGQPDPRGYAQLVKVSHRALTGFDSRAEVITAGLPEFHSNGMPSKRYLKQFYRVRNIERSFDALGVHAYARNHRGIKGVLVRTRDLLSRLGDKRRPIWLTEFGYASDGSKSPFVSTEQGQANKLAKTIALLRRTRERFRLGTVTSYRWRDSRPPSGGQGDWQEFAGLFRDDGSVKPACRAYVRFTGGSCQRIDDGFTAASRGPVAPSGSETLDGGSEELLPSAPAP